MNTKYLPLLLGVGVLYWGWTQYRGTQNLPRKPAVQTESEKQAAAEFNDNPLF